MFILTITDALGMTYVEAFHEESRCVSFIPPASAKLKTPTKRTCVCYPAAPHPEDGQVVHV